MGDEDDETDVSTASSKDRKVHFASCDMNFRDRTLSGASAPEEQVIDNLYHKTGKIEKEGKRHHCDDVFK